ncbi:MAG TPA: hypothetical protein VGQ53_10560 [Chitinophagaceae bacterium]|nr:hypothetical protein [Chitinophagaceae bacterium]
MPTNPASLQNIARIDIGQCCIAMENASWRKNCDKKKKEISKTLDASSTTNQMFFGVHTW